jgi:hypothetical protein
VSKGEDESVSNFFSSHFHMPAGEACAHVIGALVPAITFLALDNTYELPGFGMLREMS